MGKIKDISVGYSEKDKDFEIEISVTKKPEQDEEDEVRRIYKILHTMTDRIKGEIEK